MVVGLAVVLFCQLVGEIFAYLTHLPLPAPVVGLVLLFVPAGVGIVQRLGILEANVLGVVAIVVVTTAFSIVVTAFTFRVVSRWFPAPAEGAE